MDLSRRTGETDFEWELRLCLAKKHGEIDADWAEIVKVLNLDITPDQLRKQSVGYVKVYDYLQSRNVDTNVDDQIRELRKERIKMQTANLERNRIERSEARQELYYEHIGQAVDSLPIPNFQIRKPLDGGVKSYLVTLADIHYGANFISTNNIYSPDIAKQRLECLAGQIIDFVNEHRLSTIHIAELGDTLQGLLRISDVRLNDSSVVKSLVDVSRLLALFLTNISQYCDVEYYHVPFANHTQVRPLGTKANELADEDCEYIMGNYIKDLCTGNPHIHFNFAGEHDQYLAVNINGFEVLMAHGHTLKNYKTALNSLSVLRGKMFDYLIVGHFHGGDIQTSYEGILNDCETIVCPSFCGSDPYSDSLHKGSKASCLILGFDMIYGHNETYKLMLN